MSLMKRNLSDYFVALSVIACSIVLLGALTFALSGYRFKKPTRTLQINYEDVTGIKIHSEVRYAGAPAGRVIAMRHLTAKEREASANKKDAVRVTVSLDEGIPPLPTDVTAALSSDTMLSPKFVALSAGTPGGQTLANNAAIEGHPAYGLEQITAAAGPLFENANKLLDNLNVTVTGLKRDLNEFTPKLGPLADSLKLDVDNLQNVVKNLEGMSKDARGSLEFEGGQHARESARGSARGKTKPHHFQRQTGQAHTGIRNPQKLQTSAGKKTVTSNSPLPNLVVRHFARILVSLPGRNCDCPSYR